MIIDFKNLRPSAEYPVYPPYHKGDYLEEYFYKFYIKNKNEFDKTGYTLIPIFWTNVYITNKNVDLIQYYLDSLPPGKYFTVSQHDDAVKERLPEGTVSFEAGGNKNGIPIPLICSPLSEEQTQPAEKEKLCSFTGSNTHDIRNKIRQLYGSDSDFSFIAKDWNPAVSSNDLHQFIERTKRTKFTLCPRGYGAQSFRLYEVLQLDSIPVIVYDKRWFPFEDSIDWNSFCVLIHSNDIHIIKDKITSIDDQQYSDMLSRGKQIYKEYFTMEGMSRAILNILKTK
jgi:hypothetical protein